MKRYARIYVQFLKQYLKTLLEYKEDFIQLYKIYLKGVKNYDVLSEREQKIKSEEIKQQVKEFLLRNNTKYRILNERGLI